MTTAHPDTPQSAAPTRARPAAGLTCDTAGPCTTQACGCASPTPTRIGRASRRPTRSASRASGARMVPIAAGASAAAAVACALCCVVPLAFPAIALSAAGGVIAAVAGSYRWTRALAAMLVLAAWLWAGFESWRYRRAPARTTVLALAAATLLLVAAVSWPVLEPRIVAALRSANGAPR